MKAKTCFSCCNCTFERFIITQKWDQISKLSTQLISFSAKQKRSTFRAAERVTKTDDGRCSAPNLVLHWPQTKENTEGVCQLLLTSADAIFDPLFSAASPCLSTPSRLSSSPLPSSRGGSQQQVKDHDPPHKDRLPIPSGGESSAPASRTTRGGWMGWKGGYLSTS